ncbi:MAG: hypothetical protein COT91_00855 [Candidatus Doudnabacteria bacterium CG10_big_fil_rev_8_21_14_0_10_41_10]|uniref:Uncharacterized protein n=1 Tax=Candidatus Doudnabacteria bacterium CG10_big_fil_rev_8_21_14_0_10_41_10 TaxID=1974551 RepID=A0A2H0VEM8_9BACT|nr:MAG: hypothetical protein COT91_00855 [Candidatus Doudnabacteria bacterium CG10_big_fil_rev_8_21_14_0_10_41_10]
MVTVVDCFQDCFSSDARPKRIMEAIIATARQADVDGATVARLKQEGWHIACDILHRAIRSRAGGLNRFKIVIEFRANGYCYIQYARNEWLTNQAEYEREKPLDQTEAWHGSGMYWIKAGQCLGTYFPIGRPIVEHLDWYQQVYRSA